MTLSSSIFLHILPFYVMAKALVPHCNECLPSPATQAYLQNHGLNGFSPLPPPCSVCVCVECVSVRGLYAVHSCQKGSRNLDSIITGKRQVS